MSERSAKDMAVLLWSVISNYYMFQAFTVPEDKAEILNRLIDRLDEEMNQLVPESTALL